MHGYTWCSSRKISIHTPARGVTQRLDALETAVTNFNPHSRTGSDSTICGLSHKFTNFNPHSRTGSDPIESTFYSIKFTFQSTLPHGE